MRVLITRPAPDADAFAAQCAANGLSPVIAPLMETVFHDAAPVLDGVGALAFTSANGVRAFSRLSDVRDLAVFAVGEATAQEASAAGFGNIEAAEGDVLSLAALIGDRRDALAGDVLHAAGTRLAGDLLSLLKQSGVGARRAVLYEMREASALPERVTAALKTRPALDWATFFSPRSAALFAELVARASLEDALAGTRAACLSDAAAEKVAHLPWAEVRIASRRSAEAMIAAMTQTA